MDRGGGLSLTNPLAGSTPFVVTVSRLGAKKGDSGFTGLWRAHSMLKVAARIDAARSAAVACLGLKSYEARLERSPRKVRRQQPRMASGLLLDPGRNSAGQALLFWVLTPSPYWFDECTQSFSVYRNSRST